ncbi:MAG TPA: hypothetical protein VF723_09240 [Pyrinomonadaceae bacterium]|jgi:hypothetical protein
MQPTRLTSTSAGTAGAAAPGINGRSETAHTASAPLILFLLLLLCSLAACSSSHVVETVTTDASRESALPAGAEPIALEPRLPARDPDIEMAGDRVAEAITYLNTHRRDRREIALRALNQAEAAIAHALRAAVRDERARALLHLALKDLDSAEHAVQHGAPEADKQLASLNKSLDELNHP